jgi:hypothetical protein
MGTRNPPLIPYTKSNLKKVIKLIEKNLSQDLLPKKYHERNSKNWAFGHCHNASGCLYKIFGSENLHMYRALDDEEIWHWWVMDRDENIIDPTATQYKASQVKKLYKQGTKASLLGFDYKKRVEILLKRVTKELRGAL